jgi:hypothetical protein
MTGAFALLAWGIAVFKPNTPAQWLFVVLGIIAVLASAFRVWQINHRQLRELGTPRFKLLKEVVVSESTDECHCRVALESCSDMSVSDCKIFWVRSDPQISDIPIPLHCASETRPQSAKVTLEPHEKRVFDVCRVKGKALELTGANPHEELPIRNERYFITLRAYGHNAPYRERVYVLDATKDTIVFYALGNELGAGN